VSLLVALLTLALATFVVAVVIGPLRAGSRARAKHPTEVERHGAAADAGAEDQRAAIARDELARDELDAAREAKYREIRDCELDFLTGKLSPEDYRAIDAQLRAEAIEILDRFERLTTDS